MTSAAPGWYGKMPALGDFAQRRLPATVVAAWDDWLQDGIAASRAALGDAWLTRYLNAPVWRFWIAPGVLDDDAWTGAMMASVDRVGRYFPLAVMTALGTSPATIATVPAADAWFANIEQSLLRCLDLADTVERFEADLAGTSWPAPNAPDEGDALSQWWTRGQDVSAADTVTTAPLAPGASPLIALQQALTAPATGAARGLSLWWREAGSDAAALLRFTGLPPAGYFASLLANA